MTQLSTDARDALQLYRRLVAEGLEPDYAERRVEKSAPDLEPRSTDSLVAEIVEGTPEQWKGGAASSAGEAGPTSREESEAQGGGGANYYDRLWERIEAERKEKRQRSGSAHERLGGGL